MTRTLVLCLVSLAAAPPIDPTPDIVLFETTWVPFLRQLAGCPLSGPVSDMTRQCNSKLGSWNYELFFKVSQIGG